MTAPAKQETTNLNPASYTRLHITPLDSDLLGVVLSTSILPRARNVSYHSIQTFPEKRYGFVELPAEDADKIRKKLNGAVLKGVKIRIEQARPESRPAPLGDAAMAGEKDEIKAAAKKEKRNMEKSSRKRKREGEEIPGVELEPGRKVKRGWTVTGEEQKARKIKEKREKKDKAGKDQDKGKDKKKDKKKEKGKKREVKSKYTDHPECLIKTSLPNKSADTADDTAAGEVGERKRRKKSKSTEVVVHEFEKTTKFPTFLKNSVPSSSSKKLDLEFVDGKGWVDEEGNVVEAVRSSRPAVVKSNGKAKSQQGKNENQDHSSSSEGTSSDESEPEDVEHKMDIDDGAQPATNGDSEQAERASPAPQEKEDNNPANPVPSTATPSTDVPHQSTDSSSSPKSLTIKIPPPPTTPKVVHPLEALYKRPKQQPGPNAESEPKPQESEPFGFFFNGATTGSDDDAADEEEDPTTLQIPMTPFTRQDFESRGIRSAAPTPDTVHANRTFKLWPRGEEDLAEDEEGEGEDGNGRVHGDRAAADGGLKTQEGGQATTSDFQDWFWENRGDLNRSWKRRRKMVAKEKRYRENKARADRAV